MFFLWWEKCITETLVTREAFVKKRLRLTMKYLSAGKFITVHLLLWRRICALTQHFSNKNHFWKLFKHDH